MGVGDLWEVFEKGLRSCGGLSDDQLDDVQQQIFDFQNVETRPLHVLYGITVNVHALQPNYDGVEEFHHTSDHRQAAADVLQEPELSIGPEHAAYLLETTYGIWYRAEDAGGNGHVERIAGEA